MHGETYTCGDTAYPSDCSCTFPKGSYFENRSGTGRVAKGVADGLWRRAQQLKLRVEKLQDYLQPIERTTLHHPGDALAHKKGCVTRGLEIRPGRDR